MAVSMRKPDPVEVDRGAVDLGGDRVRMTTLGHRFPPLVRVTPSGDIRSWLEGEPIEGRPIG